VRRHKAGAPKRRLQVVAKQTYIAMGILLTHHITESAFYQNPIIDEFLAEKRQNMHKKSILPPKKAKYTHSAIYIRFVWQFHCNTDFFACQ
jgi:hypothetical protein